MVGRPQPLTKVAVSAARPAATPPRRGMRTSRRRQARLSARRVIIRATIGTDLVAADRHRQPKIFAQCRALILGAEQAAALQFRDHHVDEIGQRARQPGRHHVEPVGRRRSGTSAPSRRRSALGVPMVSRCPRGPAFSRHSSHSVSLSRRAASSSRRWRDSGPLVSRHLRHRAIAADTASGSARRSCAPAPRGRRWDGSATADSRISPAPRPRCGRRRDRSPGMIFTSRRRPAEARQARHDVAVEFRRLLERGLRGEHQFGQPRGEVAAGVRCAGLHQHRPPLRRARDVQRTAHREMLALDGSARASSPGRSRRRIPCRG